MQTQLVGLGKKSPVAANLLKETTEILCSLNFP